MRSETEPFTTAETEVAVPVIDNLELPNSSIDVANEPEVTIEEPQDTKTDNTNIINGIEYTKQPESYRLPAMVKVPNDYKVRIDVIAAIDRRKVTSMIEIALDEYLKLPICEPRPYLPFSPKDCTVRLNFYAEKKVLDSLELRAAVECRSLQDLIRRAIVSYVEASPYDPAKLKAKEGRNVSGNVPETIPEDSQ